MSHHVRDFIFAAHITKKANAMCGNGKQKPWTAEEFRDLASSAAAETGKPGICPACKEQVHATGTARIRQHRNQAGLSCPMAGEWFFLAVP